MEFNEKLQVLRKRKGLTQEELAEKLFVSRAAVSKWESGRGYPNIDSLKTMAGFFEVSIDELLTDNKGLTDAERDAENEKSRSLAIVCGVFDICTAALLFLPLFASRTDGLISAASLINLCGVRFYIKAAFAGVVSAAAVWGIVTILFTMRGSEFFKKHGCIVSACLSGAGLLLFAACAQPYAAAFLLVLLLIRVILMLRGR